MEMAQDLSKGSPKDVSGSFDTGVLIPVQLPTLNILAAWFKEGPKSTNIEQFREALNKIFQDPVLSGFMVDYFNQGTKLLKEHGAILRGGLDKFTRNKRLKNAVGEEASIHDGSGNKGYTNVDGTFVDVLPELVGSKATAVGAEANVSADMLQELDEAEATAVGAEAVGIDETDDDQTDDDETDDDQTDEDDDQTDDDDDQTDDDQTYVGETYDDMGAYDADQVLIPDTRSLIEKLIDDPFFVPLAERIANDKDLIGIANKLLEPLRNADGITSLHAIQHSEAVALFWKNEHFRKGLHEELLESFFYLSDDLLYFSNKFIAEPPEDRMIRIKADPSCKKVLDADDPVVRMSGVLSILIGYWINKDVLVELAKAMDGPDLPDSMKRVISSWLR